MPVGDEFRIEGITRGHVLAEARTWGVPETVAIGVIETALECLRAGMLPVDARYPSMPAAIRALVTTHFERFVGSAT